MLVLSLITLAIASASAFLSLHTKEDVVKAAMACMAIVAIFLTLSIAPWPVKAIVFVLVSLSLKINNWSTERSTNS
jgi:hypothetical protein